MSKFKYLLLLFSCIILLILSNLFMFSHRNKNLVPVSFNQNAIYNNDNYNLIVSILKDTNKNNLLEYVNYIKLDIIDSIPNSKFDQIAFILSLPEDICFIAFYNKIDNNNYKFSSLVDNLSLVNDFYFYKDFLVVEQTNNNLSTKIKNNFFEVFILNELSFKSVLKKDTYNESILKINNEHFKEVKVSSLDYLSSDIPKFICITTTTTYKLSAGDSLEKVNESTQKEIYGWHSSLEQFIILESELLN